MFSPKENQSSIGAIWDCVNQKAVLPPFTKTSNNKYDHIITNLVMDNISYDWSFLQHYCVNSERYFKNKGIEIGYPDHAILIAEITFSGIDN